MAKTANKGFLGKYSILLIGVALFFVLSVGIFGINYFLLVQIANDATKINDSGRLRGLTQQHAKAVLSLSHEHASGEPVHTSQAQISESVIALAETLARARARAQQAGDESETEIIAKFEKAWKPMEESSLRLLNDGPLDAGEVDALRIRSTSINVKLMQIADDLTSHQEEVAAARAKKLKFLQGAAIVVAALLFIFIVDYAFRSLRRSDRLAEQARRETEQILGTVREGLFLIDRQGVIGQQRSSHLDRIFPCPLEPGGNFYATLASLVSHETMESVRNYVGLLFNGKVKLSLVESLNPLDRVEIADQSHSFPIYLSFSFSPVIEENGGQVSTLLISVIDISQKVYLERELANAEERTRSEMSLLLGILKNDPGVVAEFLANASQRLDEINTLLRDLDPRQTSYNEVINRVFRIVHSIKGEAAALTLGAISEEAHDFEDTLTPLRRNQTLSGEDLIPVATHIGNLQQAIAKVKQITDQISAYAAGSSSAAHSPVDDVAQTMQRIQRLALAVAADLNKRIRVETSIEPVDELPEDFHRLLREGLPQLVRNAVVHGIETSDERLKAGKPAEGLLRIELKRPTDTHLEITVSDDGRGIDIHKLRSKLVATGRRSAQQAAEMSDQDVIASIFEPGFSTAEEVSEHAGRGVGLDMLLSLARSTGARMRVASTPLKATRFTLQWSPT